MISESTARLVEHIAVLDDPSLVNIKNAPRAGIRTTPAGNAASRTVVGRRESTLVGRDDEMDRLRGSSTKRSRRNKAAWWE